MFNISEEFFIKLMKDFDILPIFSLDMFDMKDEMNEKKLEELNEPLENILAILKYKLALIHKEKSASCDFNIMKLVEKFSDAEFEDLYELVLFSLLIQNSTNELDQLIDDTYSKMKHHIENTQSTFRNLLMLDVLLEISQLTGYDCFKKFDEEYAFQGFVIKLISRSQTDINKKLVLEILPKYLYYRKDEEILIKLWNAFQDERVMYELIISGLEDFFMPDSDEHFTVLKEEKFWKQLQIFICDKNPIVRRESLYTLKTAVSVITSNACYKNTFVVDSTGKPLVGCSDNMERYEEAWNVFFDCCNAMKEKSLHLIEPTLCLYDAMEPLHISWRKCITQLCLQHSHQAVVTHAVQKALTVAWPVEIKVLVQALNNEYLYDRIHRREVLIAYVNNMTEEELEQFVYEFLKMKPAPYSFFNICCALRKSKVKVSTRLIRRLLELAQSVPHMYLRVAATKLILDFIRKLQVCNTEAYMTDLMYILCECFESGKAFESYIGIVPVWIDQLDEASYKIIIKRILQMKMENEPVKKVKGCGIFIAFCNQVNKSALQHVFNTRYFEAIDKVAKCHRFNYLIFVSQIIRLVEQCVLRVPVDGHYISYILLKLMSVCCATPAHDQDDAFVENASMTVGIAMHIYNDMEKMGLVSNFIRLLVEAENHTGCLLLCTALLQQYPSYKLNTDCPNKVYYLEQVKMLEGNLDKAKDAILAQPDILREKKHRMMSNYVEAMLIIRKLEVEANDEDEPFKTTILNELPNYLDIGGPTVILRVLDCTLATLAFEWKISSDFNRACTNILQICLDAMFALKSGKLFNATLTKFLIVLIQPAIKCSVEMQQFATKLFNIVFNDEDISSEHRLEILQNLRCNTEFDLLYQALVYGPVPRKDKRGPDDNITLRVQAICILFNKLDDNCPENELYCFNLMFRLVGAYDEISKKRYFLNSKIHLKKVRILQTMHLLIKSQRRDVLLDIHKKFLDYLVNESNQTDVKIFIQWLLVKIIKQVKDRQLDIIAELIILLSKLQKPTCVIPILYHVLKWKAVDLKTVTVILEKLTVCAMGPHFTVRYFAQEAIKKICAIYGANLMTTYEHIYQAVCNVQAGTKIKISKDFSLGFMHLDTSLETLYTLIPRICDLGSEAISPCYFSNYGSVPFPSYIPLHSSNSDLQAMEKNVLGCDDPEQVDDVRGIIIQRKVQGADEKSTKPGNLVVVASLITCKPNLGGLSRTCEVLGVKEYVISNLKILESPDYKNLSKTSENWLKVSEVKVDDLPKYLKEMKENGYRIVGAEQTNNSTNLNNYVFEKNSVLVLGNEKLGIPPNLLHILDDCIEIPQYGQLRSLNVHVTGSLCIWEYVKQH